MASSLVPDTTVDPEKQQQHNPLLSALRPGPAGTPVAALQFESNSGLLDELEDSDEDMPRTGEKRSGRRKIKIEYIDDKSRRHITFSKRKAGIMKKAYELSTLTGTQVLLLVASETGHVYTFATPKLQPLITKQEGKNLIQACLNSPDNLQSALPMQAASHSAHAAAAAAHHHHAVASNLQDYLPSVSSVGAYDNDITEDDLATSRSNSALNVAVAHGYLPTGTTPTPPAGGSAVAAAAAQAFMNSGGSVAGSSAQQYANYSQNNSSGAYWNGPGGVSSSTSGMYAAQVPHKSQQQQQQHSQQQMYHALMQQQQLYQQYQQQQQQQQQQMQKQNSDSNDS